MPPCGIICGPPIPIGGPAGGADGGFLALCCSAAARSFLLARMVGHRSISCDTGPEDDQLRKYRGSEKTYCF